MKKETVCPVCLGTTRLRGLRKSGGQRIEYEVKCWACRGSGKVQYEEDERSNSLKTIVPGDPETD
jgi:DnaJ-class molecular chaperone